MHIYFDIYYFTYIIIIKMYEITKKMKNAYILMSYTGRITIHNNDAGRIITNNDERATVCILHVRI